MRPTRPARLMALALPALTVLVGCRSQDRPVLDGRVEAYLTDLGPRVGGRVAQLEVHEGQRVKKGDLLALISAEELGAAVSRDQAAAASAEARRLELAHGSRAEDVAQAEARVKDGEAALKLAEDNLKRAQKLAQDGAISQAEKDRAQADRDRAAAGLQVQHKALAELRAGARTEQRAAAEAEAKKAQATYEQSRIQAGFTEIRAPFDGVVVHRLREVGSVLSAGQPVLTVARLDQLWVRLYLPQPIQSEVRQGMALTVLAAGRELKGTLDEVGSEAEYTPKMVETREERVNLVYPARVHLPQGWDKGLMPGQAVEVRLDQITKKELRAAQ